MILSKNMDAFLFSKILSICVLSTHILLILFFLLTFRKLPDIQRMMDVVRGILRRYGLLCAAAIAIIATVSPLIFSFVYYFDPCLLCWFQRVFMFPLAILLPIMYLRDDYKNKIYIFILASIGLCIGIYHYITQLLNIYSDHAVSGCSADPSATQCSATYFVEFGYITIPAMAITGFILILFFTYFAGRKN